MSPKNSSRSFLNHFTNLLPQKRVRKFHFGWIVLVLVFTFGATQFFSLVGVWASRAKPAAEKNAPSRLSENVSVRAADRNTSTLKLSDGHDVLTSYVGTSKSRQALSQNEAGPLALAAADFDEDGIPDLVSGYAATIGLITIDRGNTDTIHYNSNKTDAPFLSPGPYLRSPSSTGFHGYGRF